MPLLLHSVLQEPIWGNWLEGGLARAFLSLADFFLNIVPESKATKHLSPHSNVSVVAAEQWREGTQRRGERASPRKECWYLCRHCHLLPWVAFPSLDMVPTLRACFAVLVLTSDFGREEEMNKEHRGRTNQPQLSWRTRLLVPGRYVTRLGERTWQTLSPSQPGGGTNNYTGFAKRGGAFHLASKYKA